MHVLFATSELAPFVKAGGLADVSAAFPRALIEEGCRVDVILPAYPPVRCGIGASRCLMRLDVLGLPVEILRARHGGLTVYLVACEPLYGRDGGPYGDSSGRDFTDNALRFGVFARAVAALLAFGGRVGCSIDVLHLNDWPSALAAAWAAALPQRPATVFGIHNLAYQGLFPAADFQRLQLPSSWWSPDGIEFHGQLSFLKAGLQFADRITAVSPSYAAEILSPQFGVGLDGLLRHVSTRLSGILNGIDTAVWNPATDPHLPVTYDAESLPRKSLNTAALRQELGLAHDPAAAVLAFIGRLVEQKGVDAIISAIDRLVALPAQVVVLGVGEPRYEQALRRIAERFPGRVAYVDRSDEALAHRIEAGADLFLMPSRFEPCGLNQMYSMRYGTVPVVRRTGGLADTVRQVWHAGVDDGTGFLFDDPTPEALTGTVRSALGLRARPETWRRIQENGMRTDFSWHRSARQYVDLYRTALASISRP